MTSRRRTPMASSWKLKTTLRRKKAPPGSCYLSERVGRVSSRSLSGGTVRYRSVETVLSGTAHRVSTTASAPGRGDAIRHRLDPVALIYNFRSHEEFMTRGVGVGILHQGTFVSGASFAAVGGGKLEIELQTHRRFRRRGLARAVTAGLILYCLEQGIEACWDAANEPSAALARQLGFHSIGKCMRGCHSPGRGRTTAPGSS
jgi:GNAT superfamily N-acetyltransferase